MSESGVPKEFNEPVNVEGIADKNVRDVITKFANRANHGFSKYGVTTERTDLKFKDWLLHAQQEQMDSVVYLERLLKDEARITALFDQAGKIIILNQQMYDLLEMMWMTICNVSSGDWTKQNNDWQQVADQVRTRWHAMLESQKPVIATPGA